MLQRLGSVNYKVRENGGEQGTKVIHVNNAKLFVERKEFWGNNQNITVLNHLKIHKTLIWGV